MLSIIGSILAALLSWWRGRDAQKEAQTNALKESQEDARAFAAPDRNKPDTIAAFKLHRDESA